MCVLVWNGGSGEMGFSCIGLFCEVSSPVPFWTVFWNCIKIVLSIKITIISNTLSYFTVVVLSPRTCDRKVVSSNPGRSGDRIFFSRVDFVCWLSFGVRSTPVLPQWHIKDPGHSAKSAGGRLHLNTHIPVTQQSRSVLAMLLSRHSVGPVRKWAHTQFLREHLVTVISARWANVDWSWPKEWN